MDPKSYEQTAAGKKRKEEDGKSSEKKVRKTMAEKEGGVCCYHYSRDEPQNCHSNCIFRDFLMYDGGKDYADWEFLLDNSPFKVKRMLEDAKEENRRQLFQTLVRITRDFEKYPVKGPYQRIENSVKALREVKHILEGLKIKLAAEHQAKIKQCIDLIDSILETYSNVETLVS